MYFKSVLDYSSYLSFHWTPDDEDKPFDFAVMQNYTECTK